MSNWDIPESMCDQSTQIAQFQFELAAAKAEIERLRGRLDSYICAVSTMDIVTQKAYVSGAATVHNIKQIVAEAAEKGGDDA